MKKIIALMASVAMMVCAIVTPVHAETATVTTEEQLIEAVANGGNVTLGKDIKIDNAIEVTGTVVLDLNGYKLSHEYPQTEAHAMITNKGTLTIKDSSSAKTGEISYADTTEYTGYVNYVSNTISNQGTITVESGAVRNVSGQSVANAGFPHAIDNFSGSKLTINGGTVENLYYSAIRMFCSNSPITVTINGGTIINAVDFQNPEDKERVNDSLTINGGTFKVNEGTTKSVRLVNFGTKLGGMKLTINGGTFAGAIGMSNFTSDTTTDFLDGITTITGGTFSNDVTAYVANGYDVVKGSDNTYTVSASLQTIIDNAKADSTIILTKDYTVDEIITINKSITIDGNGHTVTGSAQKVFEVYKADETVTNVTFENIDIVNTNNYGRCIDTRTDKINLTVKDSTLTAKGTGNTQPLTIGGSDTNGLTITLQGTTIDAGDSGYGVISFVKHELNVVNSEITGYAAIYVKDGSSSSRIVVDGSTLNGVNTSDPYAETNNFGTLVFESNNLNVQVKNSTVNAKATEEGNIQNVIVFKVVGWDGTEADASKPLVGNIHITVDGASKILGNGNSDFLRSETTTNTSGGKNNIVTVQRGAKTNFDIDYRYLAQDSYVNMETETVECTCPEVKEVPGKAPTCTEKGIKDSYVCVDPTCGKVWYDTIIKEGDEEFEVTVEANSSADLEIPALGHKEVKVPGKAATCTETGLTDGTVCEVCKEPVKVQETIAKIEHTYKDGACTVCEAKDPNYVAPEIVVEDLPTIDPKEEVEEVVVGVNKTETTEVLTNTVEEVIESVKTGEEVVGVSSAVVTVIADAIEDEKELEITTTVVVTPVKEEEVKEETVKLIVEAADGAEVVQYLDLSVLMDVKVDGQKVVEAEEVKQLAKPMTFTIAIPEELKDVEEGYERTYFIVRVHEGKTEKLPVKVNADGTLSFSTDRFSNYALAYEDTLKTITQTGDANLIVPFVAAMLVSGAVLVLLKKREELFN